MRIIEFRKGNAAIRLLARNGNAGPEAELIKSFKPYILDCFRWKKGKVALFHEPQIETGFPDLVIIQYLPEAFRKWSKIRSDLRPLDIKLLHHLFRVKAADSSALFNSLGIDARGLLLSLERLLDAKMITRAYNTWKPRPLKHLFGILSIVAVEAKMKNWGKAFKQGHLNQWFASESYILSPVEKPRHTIVERSLQTGVGILLQNGTTARRFQSARKQNIPISYGSWIFNEWIGRYLNK